MLKSHLEKIKDLLICYINSNGYQLKNVDNYYVGDNIYAFEIEQLKYVIAVIYETRTDTIKIDMQNTYSVTVYITDYYKAVDGVLVFDKFIYIENISYVLNLIFENILKNIKYIEKLQLLRDKNDSNTLELHHICTNLESYIRSEKLKLLDELG